MLKTSLGLKMVAVLAAVVVASGCGDDSPKAVPDCPISFDFRSPQKPLGDGSGLLTSARTHALKSEPVTMKSVVSGGGLQGDWDRMVVIFPGTTVGDLNAAAGTTQVCWEHLPRAPIDDGPLTAYYLFLQAGEPLQAVSWFYPTDQELNFRSFRTMAVYPDTLMSPVNGPGVEPYLILTTE